MTSTNPYAAPKANLEMPGSGEVDTTSPFSPKGRFARSTYLAYSFGTMIVFWIILAVLGGVGMMTGNMQNMGIGSMIIMGIAYIGILVIGTIFGLRRLHDLDWSGWWIVAMFIPIANLFLAVPMLFFRGTPGSNRYGAPRPATRTHLILAWLLLALPLIGIIAAISIPAYVDYTKRAKAGSLEAPTAIEQPQDARP